MRFGRVLFSIGLLGLLTPACGEPSPDDPSQVGELVASQKQRNTSPATSASELAELAEGNAAFALDLYRKLEGRSENLFFSPHSISLALTMALGGARGATETEMQSTLHATLAPAKLHQAWNALDLALASRGKGATGKDGNPFRLKVANAAWGQRSYSFLPGYLDLLAESYGAGMRVVNFIDQPEDARLAINRWVALQTEDRIKELLAEGTITPVVRLVLTNAIYFNASWRDKFEPEATTPAEFTKRDGSTVKVQMMHKTDRDFHYAKANGCQAVELPYDGDELSMVVMLPDGKVDAFEAGLDAAALKNILGSLASGTVVELGMPRFKIEGSFGLAEQLKALGMGKAFSSEADFSGIDGTRSLFISDVIHKSWISVDEAGTEAAAATAVIMAGSAGPPETVKVTLDRPFLFLIRDRATGAVLFLGRVANPA
jgi:serpin B